MLVVIFALQQFCRRRAVVSVVNRDEHIGENEQADDSGELPPCQEQHLVPVHAHQLISREICQRDRAGDEVPAQAAIREKIVMLRAAITGRCIAATEISQKPDQRGDEKEYGNLHGAHMCFSQPLKIQSRSVSARPLARAFPFSPLACHPPVRPPVPHPHAPSLETSGADRKSPHDDLQPRPMLHQA